MLFYKNGILVAFKKISGYRYAIIVWQLICALSYCNLSDLINGLMRHKNYIKIVMCDRVNCSYK